MKDNDFKKNSISKNYIFSLVYQILTLALPLLTTPYLSRTLGANSIGIYGYTVSIVTCFVLFGTLGISMYGQREIAYYQKNVNNRSKTFWELIIIRAITLSISGVLFYIFFCINNIYNIYYRILIIYLFANVFDISWFFQGIERFDKIVLRNLIIKFLGLLLIFIFVKNKSDLWIYFGIYSGSEFLGNISIWFYLKKFIKKVSLKNINLKKHIKPILILFLPQIAIQLYTVLDKTMIGFITKNMVEVGYYEQAQKIVKAFLIVSSSLHTVMNSAVANAYAENNELEIKKCLEKTFSFVWILNIPIMFGLIALAPTFVPWYYGKGFDGVINIIIASSPIIIAIGLNGITGVEYLIQTKQHNIFTNSVIFGCIVNIILNIVLIRYFNGVGAAIASVIAETIIFIYQLYYYNKKYSFKNIILNAIKPFFASVIMFILLKIIINFMGIGILYTIIEFFIGFIVYSLIMILFKEKYYIYYLKGIIKKFKSIRR